MSEFTYFMQLHQILILSDHMYHHVVLGATSHVQALP